METLRQHLIHQNDATSSPSPEMFSFPGTPTEVDDVASEFEFGSCVTPGSPSTTVTDPSRSSASPADQFFLNGRLLPHDFPVVPATSTRSSFSGRENITTTTTTMMMTSSINLSRGTSVGSSNKDSLTSSRSNSTNSSGGSTCSTCTSSSARSSSGETFQKRSTMRKSGSVRNVSGLAQYQYHKFGGSSLRTWQFITPAPVLGPSRSRRGRRESGVGSTAASPRRSNKGDRSNSNGNEGGFLQRILRSFVATCKACHAMEGQENEFDLDAGVLGN